MELPQYTLKPNTFRMVTPWIIKLLVLSTLFYTGIILAMKLSLKMEIPSFIHPIIGLVLLALVIIQTILYKVKFGKFKYVFFTNRIEFEGEKPLTFLFTDFKSINIKQDFLDKLFGTGNILLEPNFKIDHISNIKQIEGYLNQLITYFQKSRSSYQGFKPFHDNKQPLNKQSQQPNYKNTQQTATQSNPQTNTQAKQPSTQTPAPFPSNTPIPTNNQ
ncbi:hypothetical protein HN587_00495 [Candidatus Woesearchaeota archaeon]|jgi:hypothetical protein|nr:hypothetical protein [Candidatus Woesearchaeota archaeon]